MANLVVVAIPSEDDYVWKISSEKVPHMTLLFLGEMPVENFAQIAGFVQHAASTSLTRFGMEVDRRGELGPNLADVLFFDKSKWSGYPEVAAFRSYLLQDANVKAAYEANEQFPEWLPHLTLGFPETPAKKDTRDYPGFSYVSFDRIALWFEDYSGAEFQLARHDILAEVAMAGTTEERTDLGRKNIASLMHYGVKGMKWGVRRKQSNSSRVTVSTGKLGGIKTRGGKGRAPSADAKKAAVSGQIAKKSGYQALSNKQLQQYTQRKDLEKKAERIDRGNSFVTAFFTALEAANK
jgi:2'-5' RNA ligase